MGDDEIPFPPPPAPAVPFPWLPDGDARRLGVSMGLVPMAGEGSGSRWLLYAAGGLLAVLAVVMLRRR
jgi:hypothetical protein